jgi:hypothetical protein
MGRQFLARAALLAVAGCVIWPQGGSAGGPWLGKPKAVSKEDWDAAQGKPTGPKDLRVSLQDHYIGGIDRVWWLIISGPPTNKFHYGFLMVPGNGTELHGNYEVKDGLAYFKGTEWDGTSFPDGKVKKDQAKGTPVRLALNFRRLDDKTYFNVLCRNDKGHYLYERKWFFPVANDWKLQEHHRLSFTLKEATDLKLTFLVNAELTRWDDTIKELTKQSFKETVSYDAEEKFWRSSKNQPGWLPTILRRLDGKVSAKELPDCFLLDTGSGFGAARGFSFGAPPKWGNP